MDARYLGEMRQSVRAALEEDIGSGDVTTLSTVPPEMMAKARMVAREDLVLAGLEFAEQAFRELSPDLQCQRLAQDGQRMARGETLLLLEGTAQAILTAERVALNFAQRLSGVATLAAQYVAAVQGTRARILDTRKTTPGWRRWEKYAVTCGGACNHRFGLYDMVLIKDNHLTALAGQGTDAIQLAVQRARMKYPHLRIEVEADTLAQVESAVRSGADIVLLDNMSLEELKAAVQIAAGIIQTEASGGVTLSTIRAIAETGVDFISVGAMTHSARAVDIALDFEEK